MWHTAHYCTSLKPVKTAAGRQPEMMAIIANDQAEDAEWIDEEFLNICGGKNYN